MKNIILILFAITTSSCNAQNLPLSTKYSQIPNNAHIKDLNNDLNKYVGSWNASVGDKQIHLYITKQEDRPINLISKSYYSDVLVIKYEILVNNQIVESTKNYTLENANITSMDLDIDGSIIFDYEGGKCGVGWGMIDVTYIDSTHLKWNYIPESTVITNINCPDYPAGGIKINLPDEPKDIIFTKQ
ncbi:hypothetical protein ATE47_16160 [Chryseobacterium sp. IHB B 17019]|jgi:hypothetical protein|uniref:DUF6705 family protein n=1 Tax=Chryseobacterium sp. IHB B 17019 TaxID=1721091 RepID=UPI000720E0A7|nr:DUF6705 family protein [Chryseobacterium sp. IHB B 17019]ALR31955.1 hypothetical protein ATE47_16160 [Chryseobacterium sp. IHB B 17019]